MNLIEKWIADAVGKKMEEMFSQPTPDPKPEPTPDPKPEPAPDPKPEPAPDPKPGPAPDPKPGPAPDPKPESAKSIEEQVREGVEKALAAHYGSRGGKEPDTMEQYMMNLFGYKKEDE